MATLSHLVPPTILDSSSPHLFRSLGEPPNLGLNQPRYTRCIEIVTISLNEAYRLGEDGGDRFERGGIGETLEILASVGTVRRLYSGLDLGTKSHLYIVQEWDKIEDHQAFMSSGEVYQSLLRSVQPYTASFELEHVSAFLEDPNPVLQGLGGEFIIEVTKWTLRKGGAMEDEDEDDFVGEESQNLFLRGLPVEQRGKRRGRKRRRASVGEGRTGREEVQELVAWWVWLVGVWKAGVRRQGGGSGEGGDGSVVSSALPTREGTYGVSVENSDKFVVVVRWESLQAREEILAREPEVVGTVLGRLREIATEERFYVSLKSFK